MGPYGDLRFYRPAAASADVPTPIILVLLDKAALGGVDSKGAIGRYRGNLIDFEVLSVFKPLCPNLNPGAS